MARSTVEVPMRPFGRTGIPVSILALGGWHLGLPETERESTRLVHAAIDGGITFMDNAWDYNEGVSESRMGKALVGRRDKVFLMTKACPHGRGACGDANAVSGIRLCQARPMSIRSLPSAP